jgi:hypothetical protein
MIREATASMKYKINRGKRLRVWHLRIPTVQVPHEARGVKLAMRFNRRRVFISPAKYGGFTLTEAGRICLAMVTAHADLPEGPITIIWERFDAAVQRA